MTQVVVVAVATPDKAIVERDLMMIKVRIFTCSSSVTQLNVCAVVAGTEQTKTTVSDRPARQRLCRKLWA